MSRASPSFAPGRGHGWLGEEPDLHLRMVEAWFAGEELPAQLETESTPWDPAVVRRLLDEDSERC
jgi:hypothetical protein